MAGKIKEALEEFLRIEGVTAAAIVGRDGFVIDCASREQLDTDALGAVIAAATIASETIGNDFKMGKLEHHLLEFESGKVIIAAIANDVLVLTTDTTSVIGSVRYAVKKRIGDLAQLL